MVNINPVQDLHGQESPYPAGGGKNLLDPSKIRVFGSTGAHYGIDVTYDDGVFTFSGTATTSPAIASFNFAEYDDYSLSGRSLVIQYFEKTGTGTIRSIYGLRTESENKIAIVLDLSQSQTVNFSIKVSVAETSQSSFSPYENICPISGWTGMQLNANGTEIPISWQTEAGTVYGGTLDALSGKLTVYPYYASYNGETLTGEWISDRDVYAVGTTPTIGAQVVNIGAEGTEIQLEPHEVASLLGTNNIFADTGDTACEYRADTKLYIERLTAPDSADMIADANITSGKYFMVGNSLYKATANIANGAQIIVGTNCIRKSLSEALNEINA